MTIILILVVIAFITPYRVAFSSDDIANSVTIFMQKMYNVFDVLFLLDIIITFFTSYTDPISNQEVTDLKLITVNYIKGWFLIDIFSIFPFEQLIDTVGNINQLLRVVRLSKLLRLVRMFRLARAYKYMK